MYMIFLKYTQTDKNLFWGCAMATLVVRCHFLYFILMRDFLILCDCFLFALLYQILLKKPYCTGIR